MCEGMCIRDVYVYGGLCGGVCEMSVSTSMK